MTSVEQAALLPSLEPARVPGEQTAAPLPAEQTAAQLQALGDELPSTDGMLAFHRACVAAFGPAGQPRAHDGQPAGQPAVGELVADLAARYVGTMRQLASGGVGPRCWRAPFRLRHHPRVHPVQFALAGMNAQIGYDVPLALFAFGRRWGRELSRIEGDFERLTVVLAGLDEHVREELLPQPGELHVGDPLTHLAGSWHLERARNSAWLAFRTLWELREYPGAAGQFTEQLDAQLGLTGRCLLTPLRG